MSAPDGTEPAGPRLRVRLIIWLARVFGTRAVGDLVQALEGEEEEAYEAQPSPEVESIAADERRHAEIWRALEHGGSPLAANEGDGRVVAGAAGPDRTAAEISLRERWHRAGQTGTLRATIFGVNDGLVSNLALVMGVAGAAPGPQVILLAGIAGLLAGARPARTSGWAFESRTGNDSRSGRVPFSRGHQFRRLGSSRAYSFRVVFAGRSRPVAIASRIALLDQGRMVFGGTVEQFNASRDPQVTALRELL